MSLFERIQSKRYDLQEKEIKKEYGPNSDGKYKFDKNKINKKTGGFEDVTGENIKKGDYPKTRKELEAKRKYYEIDPKTNQPSKSGIEKYARTHNQLKSGQNIPVELTQADLDKAKRNMVGGNQIKNKKGEVIGTTTGKIGGRLADKRSKNAKTYAEIMADINKRNPTINTPIGKLPKTAANMKKFSKTKRVMDFAKNIGGKGVNKFKSLGLRGKLGVVGGLGLAATGAFFAPKIFGGDKDKLTFKKSSVIKNKSGDDVTFKYPTYSDRKTKDNLLKKDPNLKLDPYKNYSDGSYKPSIRNASTGFLGRNKNKQKPFTDKFKSGEFKVDNVPKAAIRGGDKFSLNKNLATSAFEKQLQKAEKGSGFGKNPFGKNFLKTYQTKADKKFLKKYSNATRPT